jgi:uncharacterized protein YlbG (UPF0298 family)
MRLQQRRLRIGREERKRGAIMFSERVGYIIWVNDIKAARSLDKYGTIHYISRRMHYVVMYMNADRADDIVRNIQRLPFVKKIERSYRNEIKTEYERNVPDKTRFYSL